MNAKYTAKAKEAYARLALSHNITNVHYHADNGLFDTAAFKASIKHANQTLSFCGVNDHHQNGKAERRIGDVTTGTRTSFPHVSHRWHNAIEAYLWLSAMKNYVNLRKIFPLNINLVLRLAANTCLPHSPAPRYPYSVVLRPLLTFNTFTRLVHLYTSWSLVYKLSIHAISG